MHEVTSAIRAVERALSSAPHSPGWQTLMSNRLSALRGAYIVHLQESMGTDSAVVHDNPWLSASMVMLRREQARVVDEIDRALEECSRCQDPETLRQQVVNLLSRVARTRQREVDLVYESVDMDLGGEQ